MANTNNSSLASLSLGAAYNPRVKKAWLAAAKKALRAAASETGATVVKEGRCPGGVAVCGDVWAQLKRGDQRAYVSMCGIIFAGDPTIGYVRAATDSDPTGLSARNWNFSQRNLSAVIDMVLKER